MKTVKDLLAVLVLLSLIIVGVIYYIANTHPPQVYKSFCDRGTCPLVIRQEYNGREFKYPVSAKFDVVLNGNLYNREELDCRPGHIIERASGTTSVQPPYFAVSYEVTGYGECILSDGDFSVKISIYDPS